MNILVLAAFFTLGPVLNGAPVLNTCTIYGNNELSEIKRISCRLADQRTTLTDPSIPSLDSYHLVLGSLFDYNDRREACGCPTKSKPALVEASIELNINTAWVVKHYVDAIAAYVNYFEGLSHNESSAAAQYVALLAYGFNDSIVSYIKHNYQFSSGCSNEEQTIDFSSTTNETCALECSVWHFNVTVKHFKLALESYASYNNNTETGESLNDLTCCNSDVPDLYTISQAEYKELICVTEQLAFEAYNFYQTLESHAVPSCGSNIATVSGIHKWTDYINHNNFPLNGLDNLFIYRNHFNALIKHQRDVHTILDHSTNGHLCLSETLVNQLAVLDMLLNTALDLGQKWLYAYGCNPREQCSTTCNVPAQAAPKNTVLDPKQACPNIFTQVSCLAIDVKAVAESVHMFLEFRDDAEDIRGSNCAITW